MGEIYKITNTVNGKIYVGQTTRTADIRFCGHIRSSKYVNTKYQCVIDRAIAKYQPCNFTLEVLEQCDNDLLNEREQYWIQHLNSYDRNIGYNLTRGGKGANRWDYDEIVLLYNKGLSIADICRNIGCSTSTAFAVLNLCGVYDRESVKQRGIQTAQTTRGHAVSQYDLDGNYIQTFVSAQDAARHIDKATAIRIIESCNQQKGIHGGFQWRYAHDNPPGKYNERPVRHHSVEQYSLDGQFIQTYFTIAEASRATGISVSSINNCCNQTAMRAANYLWKYQDDVRNIQEWVDGARRCCTKIAKVDPDGNVVAVYKSAVTAGRSVGKSASSITNYINSGCIHLGYFWQKADVCAEITE